MRKVLRKYSLKNVPPEGAFWKTRTFEERLDAVEFLRMQFYYNETPPRFQRVFTIVKRTSS